jgi:hypothetical protein
VPANIIVDAIDVCQSPSSMVLRPTFIPGAAGTTGYTQSRLWLTCFLTGQLAEVDPDRAQLVSLHTMGRGPAALAIDERGDIQGRKRAYVANFLDSTISLVDLDPTSLREKRMVARIGYPVPPAQ